MLEKYTKLQLLSTSLTDIWFHIRMVSSYLIKLLLNTVNIHTQIEVLGHTYQFLCEFA